MTVCDEDAAERQRLYVDVCLKRDPRVKIKTFWKRAKEMDSKTPLLPCLYKPLGIWKEFNEFGDFMTSLNFNHFDPRTNKEFYFLKSHYDSLGKITSSELVCPIELQIESFIANFSIERLVDKKARYRTVHKNPGGWEFNEFNITQVLSIEDVIKTNNAGTNI